MKTYICRNQKSPDPPFPLLDEWDISSLVIAQCFKSPDKAGHNTPGHTWLFCHILSIFYSVFHHWKLSHPLCIPPKPLLVSPHSSVDQTLRLFCLFYHIIYLQFEAEHPIILSAFPVMPPSTFTPSLIGSNPQITPTPFVTSSIFNLKNPVLSLLFIPCRSSLGDHLIPHLLTGTIHHHEVSGAPSFKKRRVSLTSANVCNALHRETWWDGVKRWMTWI